MKSKEELNEMRRRLYARGSQFGKSERHELTNNEIDVSRNWTTSNSTPATTEKDSFTIQSDIEVPPVKSKRKYRAVIFLGSLFLFAVVAIISSLYLYYGGNQISSDNIQVSVSGPNYIGGGELLAMQVTVSNQNSVPIESATLIVKYPPGTRSADADAKTLYEERIPIGQIAVGEVKKVPINVTVFGEENDNKQIETIVEYRVDGSNGMFYKDATPLALRISSSPLVLRVENIEKVSSGQLVDVTLTAVSNAPSALRDILISASYPNGFKLESSNPEPVFGDNVWQIDEILPEEKAVITLKGIVSGLTDETFRINFAAGPSDPDNRYIVAANLAEGRADFEIERPFIDVGVTIDDSVVSPVILTEGETTNVKVDIENTLDETVYDMTVEVVPGGNALSESSITSNSGFYDSNTGTVRWEVSNNPSFGTVLPGDTRSLSFLVKQSEVKTTSSFDLVVNVYARRVNETNAQETLIGTTRAEAKYTSTISIGSQVGRGLSGFSAVGPIPPRVGETTSYSLTLVAEAGANEVTNAVVEASLPVHVNWLDKYQGEGTLSYNPVSKLLVWQVGDIEIGKRKSINIQVDITPSVSQLSDLPILLNTQRIRAKDRFTGALLQDSAPAVTTELSTEMGFAEDNGRVTE
ncbi:hypothetical protein KC851_04100 [Candidatus Kaiserbacteria bacterium]|nr:hypothetical protein [Candidatus Kaiserbacteria bacterium]